MEISHDVIHIFDEPQAKHRVRNKAGPRSQLSIFSALATSIWLVVLQQAAEGGSSVDKIGEHDLWNTIYINMLYINHLCDSPFC